MAERPPRYSALDDVLRAGRFGAGHGQAPGVLLSERRGLTLVHLAGRPEWESFVDAARSALGVALPVKPNTTAQAGDLTIFWLAPTRWLIERPSSALDDLEARLRDALGPAGAAVTDVRAGRIVLQISGADARRTLAKGCPIDLHPRAFPPGGLAQSMLEGVSVMLHALPGNNALDLYIPRSYARHVWEWLTRAADPFGYEVVAGPPDADRVR